jgi:membrane protein YdbS with pleckstrin-like domain
VLPFFERAITGIVVLAGCAITIIGMYLSFVMHDPHWMNRAGALIVCVESIIVLVEFHRRVRLRRVEEKFGRTNPYITMEAIRAEKNLIILGVSMVVAGEFLHGFGDLVFSNMFLGLE